METEYTGWLYVFRLFPYRALFVPSIPTIVVNNILQFGYAISQQGHGSDSDTQIGELSRCLDPTFARQHPYVRGKLTLDQEGSYQQASSRYVIVRDTIIHTARTRRHIPDRSS